MRKLLVRLTLLVVLGGLAAGGWWWARPKTQAPKFRTAPVARGDLLVTIAATGTIEPEEVIDVGAQVAGKIERLGIDPQDSSKSIDYGSAVEAGTVLAEIDAALYRTQADQARASLARAEADLGQLRARLRQREREWQRVREISIRSAVSETERDLAEAEFESAKSALAVGEAAVAQARAALEQADTNLSYTTIRSPVKGVIIDRRVNVGQTVVASLNAPSLFLIAKDLRRLQVWAAVNEADVGQIRAGQTVSFTVDAFPGQVFLGQVQQVRLNATMTQNVVTYTVVVATNNEDQKLLPYLTANVQFEVTRRDQVLQVPNSALRWQPKPEWIAPDARPATSDSDPPAGDHRGTVWRLDGNFVRPIAVETGLANQSAVEIVAGDLHEGDLLVIGEDDSPAAQEDARNPFAPSMLRGGRRTP